MKFLKLMATCVKPLCILLIVIQCVTLKAQKKDAPQSPLDSSLEAFQYFMSASGQKPTEERKSTKSLTSQTCGTHLLYRTINGQCNNIINPDWGTAHIPLVRELPAEYGNPDPFNSLGGENRPNPRFISNRIFKQDSNVFPSATLSAFVFSWGQFLDHDIGISPAGDTEILMIQPTGEPGDSITVPITFRRTIVSDGTGITSPREQENQITAWIDGSSIYGSDIIRATWLRTGSDGKLKTSSGNLLPYNTIDNELDSPVDSLAPHMDTEGLVEVVFVSGDARANEQPGLAALHTLFHREHNRICDEILSSNPNLDDQDIYNMARKQLVSILQKITYQEFLPALGIHMTEYTGYDDMVRPDIFNAFSTAAFRLGHTMVTNELRLLDDDNIPVGQHIVSLRQAFFNTGIIAMNGIDAVFNGLAVTFQEEIDANIVEELRSFLFSSDRAGPGLDLAALNMQRGRDHGLADYNAYRTHFTGSPAIVFADITSNTDLQFQLENLYTDINDIDPWVGFLSEDKLPGAELGPTLTAMLTEQFRRLRDGDFYFYLNDPALSSSDVNTINNTTLADIIRRNTSIQTIQDDVFRAVCDPIASNCCRMNDSLSLVALYDATNGPNWTNVWDLSKAMTTWEGVFLNDLGCVQVLNLPNNNLVGPFPPEVGDLHSLTFLDLGFNSISGNIPSTISNVSNLGFLDLRNNQLDGQIPNTLAMLDVLTFLHLEYNNLSGSIPAEIANMASLGFLFLNNNNLSGCYDPALNALCNNLNAVSNTNENISDGNNFDVPWEHFCTNASGNCDGNVWPGDMNNDGVVAQNDYLFWAIASINNPMGPSRLNASTDWIAQPAIDWQNMANSINFKHQDADGNGVIDDNDRQVHLLNFGRQREVDLPLFKPAPLNYKLESLPATSGSKRYALYVKELDGSSIKAHGISCSMDFGNMPMDSVNIDIAGSSMTPDELFEYYDQYQNNLALAITRTDGVNTVCHGALAEITLAMSNVLENGNFHFDINPGHKIEMNGNLVTISGSTFYDNYGEDNLGPNNLKITAMVQHEACGTLGKATVQAYGGTDPYYAYLWNTGANTAKVENLKSGTYSVTVTDANGLTENLTVQINGQDPIYDNNGNLICASVCPDFLAPTGNVDCYQCHAKISVMSDGSILPGGEVNFKAGEAIILEEGFEVEQSAIFTALIEGCDQN